MTDIETDRGRIVAMRVPAELYHALERDAATLGVSLSDVGRMRLRTGRVPEMTANDDEVLR
jgi:hypothetical protein